MTLRTPASANVLRRSGVTTSPFFSVRPSIRTACAKIAPVADHEARVGFDVAVAAWRVQRRVQPRAPRALDVEVFHVAHVQRFSRRDAAQRREGVLENGRVALEGEAEELIENDYVQQTYLGA